VSRRQRCEAGIRFTLDDVAAVFERTPLIGNLRPGGEYHAQDVHTAGGVPMIAKALTRRPCLAPVKCVAWQ
jgi:dihydroxy-acid dehydratase